MLILLNGVALEKGDFQCVIVESNPITNFKNMLSVYRSFFT